MTTPAPTPPRATAVGARGISADAHVLLTACRQNPGGITRRQMATITGLRDWSVKQAVAELVRRQLLVVDLPGDGTTAEPRTLAWICA